MDIELPHRETNTVKQQDDRENDPRLHDGSSSAVRYSLPLMQNGECFEDNETRNVGLNEQQRPPRRRPRHHRNNKQATRNYLLFISLAFILTVSCPGTLLWKKNCKSVPNHAEDGNSLTHRKKTGCVSSTIYNESSYVMSFGLMYGSIDVTQLAKFTLHIVAVVFCYFMVHGSNPGLLTDDCLERLTELDNFEETKEQQSINGNITLNDGEICNSTKLDEMERQSFLEPLPSTSKLESPLHEHPPQSKPRSQIKHSTILCQSTRRKYCTKCQIHPPLRSHHCNICNACVATFDHHCLFLGTCIGERNHFRFWLFLVLNVVGLHRALVIVGTGHVPPVEVNVAVEMRLMGVIIMGASKIFMYPILMITTILLTIHTLLALTNSTSFEFGSAAGHIDYLRGTRMMDFLFSRGLCGNIRMFLGRDDAIKRLYDKCKCKHTIQQEVNSKEEQSLGIGWTPILWRMPEFIERESEDWWNHPWQNKYWSCC